MVPVKLIGNIVSAPGRDSCIETFKGPRIVPGTYSSQPTDLDGHSWLNPPSMGCEEYVPGTILGPLNVSMQESLPGADTMFPINFTGTISGQYSGFSWNLGDGTVVTNQFAITHAWSSPGNYPVVFAAFNDSNPAGVSVTNMVQITS